MRQGNFQCGSIYLLQFTGYPCLFFYLLIGRLITQQITTQYRRQSKCNNGRCKQSNDKRNTQRHQHASFHAMKEKQGNETYHNNQRGIQNRHTHFTGSVINHLQYRASLFRRKHPVLPYSFIHILHIDNRIIHQRTDSNRHTAQRHCINSHPHIMQNQYRNEQ